jgi:tRNA(Ile2) C34 agmatinyltransferase TiaS
MLKVKLGVYWDTQLNPYCPKCKIPLTGSTAGNNALRCAECKNDFILRHGAELLPLDVAVNKIKNNEV